MRQGFENEGDVGRVQLVQAGTQLFEAFFGNIGGGYGGAVLVFTRLDSEVVALQQLDDLGEPLLQRLVGLSDVCFFHYGHSALRPAGGAHRRTLSQQRDEKGD